MAADLSIVLPCYNESGNLPALLRRFVPVARAISLDLVLVDNGSTDDSARVLAEALRNPAYRFARTVRVERNQGYGYGIKVGLAHADACTVGFSHADLQTPPEDILRAYAIYQSFPSRRRLVKGRRPRRSTRDEAFVSRVYNTLARRVLGLPYLDVNAQPKLFDRALAEAARRGPSDFSFDLFVLYEATKAGCHIEEFDVNFEPRTYGVSKWAHRPASKAKTILTSMWRMVEMRAGRYSNGVRS